jgi:hypothetical protein
MSKNIIDIEKQYCTDIIQYYLNDLLSNSRKINDPAAFRNEIKTRLSGVIESRLLQTNLIIDYKVDVNIFPLSEKRNHQIDNILTNSYVDVIDRVTVLLKYRSHEMVAIEHLIS